MNRLFFQLCLLWAQLRVTGLGWLDSDLLYAQSMHETRKFQSESCTKGFNLFGMKQPTVRKTTAIGTFLGHAQYKSYWDSMEDYLLWLKIRGIQKTTDAKNYMSQLQAKGYAEDENYINAVLNMYNTTKKA